MDEYFRALGRFEGSLIAMETVVTTLDQLSQDPEIGEISAKDMCKILSMVVNETVEESTVMLSRMESIYVSTEASAAERPLGSKIVLRGEGIWTKIEYNLWGDKDGLKLSDSDMVGGLVIEDPLVDWMKFV